MLLSHIGLREYDSEYNEYESLKFAVNSPKKFDSKYFHLGHPSTTPYEYIANALRMQSWRMVQMGL